MRMISNGFPKILGDGITLYPQGYLSGVKERRIGQSWVGQFPCLDAATVGARSREDYKPVMESRLKAIESVSELSLVTEKECTLEVLKKYMDDPVIFY